MGMEELRKSPGAVAFDEWFGQGAGDHLISAGDPINVIANVLPFLRGAKIAGAVEKTAGLKLAAKETAKGAGQMAVIGAVQQITANPQSTPEDILRAALDTAGKGALISAGTAGGIHLWRKGVDGMRSREIDPHEASKRDQSRSPDIEEGEPLIFTRKDSESILANEQIPQTEEHMTVGTHSDMKKEIQQNKCLPTIRTEEDFKAASERGFYAASNYLAELKTPFPQWTIADLAKIHQLYFGDLYPHAGEYRKSGGLAVFNGRIGADSKHIPGELNLLLEQTRELYPKLSDSDTPSGLTERLTYIAFVHARLALIHPFKDGNGRCIRLIVSSLEKELLPDTGPRTTVPKHIYINSLKAMPSDIGPLMIYHAEKHGLRPSTLKRVPPPFPIQVTLRD